MKPCIAFLTGGYSGEAVVSYASAKTIESNIDPEKFDYYRIDLTPEGWFYTDTSGEKTEVNKNDFTLHLNGTTIQFDLAFIGIHGTPGEDGKLQGYFDMVGVPYTGCNAAVSAVTFNKSFTVSIAAYGGFHVAKSILMYDHERNIPDKLFELKKLRFPVFVKPNNGGSSIGMSKVSDKNDLEAALDKALEEDDQIIVEEAISGREFTVGVYKTRGEVVALPVTEVISKKEFFDFEAKYHGASDEITPAEIDNALKLLIQKEARRIFALFNCSGIVRLDFIYSNSERKLYLLEINTVPGQTEASLVPQQVQAAGLSLKEFYTSLIEDALSQKV